MKCEDMTLDEVADCGMLVQLLDISGDRDTQSSTPIQGIPNTPRGRRDRRELWPCTTQAIRAEILWFREAIVAAAGLRPSWE